MIRAQYLFYHLYITLFYGLMCFGLCFTQIGHGQKAPPGEMVAAEDIEGYQQKHIWYKDLFFCFCISMKYSWRYGWKTLILEEKIPLGGTAEVLLVALLSFKAVKMRILHVGTCCFGWIYLYLKFTNLLAVMHINRFVVCCFHCAGWRISFVCCCVLVFLP